jgi:hypothetical protein
MDKTQVAAGPGRLHIFRGHLPHQQVTEINQFLA